MKSIVAIVFPALSIFLVTLNGCGPKYPVNYETGHFSDTVKNLGSINSAWDDFNSAGPPTISFTLPLVFSSNRGTQGGKYDLVDYELYIYFNQYDGTTSLGNIMGVYPFNYLTAYSNTEYNEFGPFTAYLGGQEYFFFFASDRPGNMEIYTSYFNNYSFSGISSLDPTPFRVKGLNSPNYDAYTAFSRDLKQVIFSSNRNQNLDLFQVSLSDSTEYLTWARADTVYEATPIAQLNSTADDLYPYVNGKLIVFSSDREGGFGGYDLYYSIYTGTEWGFPVNFGTKINTASDECRPVVFLSPYFENDLMIFSSNRPGGVGGFDLYYIGIPKMMQ
jgi:hypothetical protein